MTALPFAANDSGAWINPRGNRRYLLWRTVGYGATTVAFVMLNPSTADPQKDDPTLRKCRAFACDWGYGLLHVANLFSIRGADPKQIDFRAQPDLFSDQINDSVLREMVLCGADRIVAAWGAQDHIGRVTDQFRQMCRDERLDLYHLGLNDGGSPKHPLYLPKDTKPEKWT